MMARTRYASGRKIKLRQTDIRRSSRILTALMTIGVLDLNTLEELTWLLFRYSSTGLRRRPL